MDQTQSTTLHILGIKWDSNLDVISIKGIDSLLFDVNTKRMALSNYAAIFDPLGLYIPVTLKLKLFLQNLWKQNLKWDESYHEDDILTWNNLIKDIKNLGNFTIPRLIVPYEHTDITEKTYKLLCFTDASENAYSAVVYLHIQSGNTSKTNLVMAKVKLTHIKHTHSIPRLELLGVFIGVKLLNFVKKQLKLSKEPEEILWTDSQCVLEWIENKTYKQLSVFVSNHLEKIQNLSNTITYRYIPTDHNPADLSTR